MAEISRSTGRQKSVQTEVLIVDIDIRAASRIGDKLRVSESEEGVDIP